jgi:hypothetical protein
MTGETFAGPGTLRLRVIGRARIKAQRVIFANGNVPLSAWREVRVSWRESIFTVELRAGESVDVKLPNERITHDAAGSDTVSTRDEGMSRDV